MKESRKTVQFARLGEKLKPKAQYTYLMYEKLADHYDIFELFASSDLSSNEWIAHFYIACLGPLLNTPNTVSACSKYSYRLIMMTLYCDSKKLIACGALDKHDGKKTSKLRAELKTNIRSMLYGLLLHTCLTPLDSNFDTYYEFITSHRHILDDAFAPAIDAIPNIRAEHTQCIAFVPANLPENFILLLNFDYGDEDTILKRCRSVYVSAGLNPKFGDIFGEKVDDEHTCTIELIFNSVYALINAYKAYKRAKIRVCDEGPNYIIVKHKKKKENDICVSDMYINKSIFRGELGIPGTRSWAFLKYILIYSEKQELRDRQYNLFSRSMADYSLLESDIKELSK